MKYIALGVSVLLLVLLLSGDEKCWMVKAGKSPSADKNPYFLYIGPCTDRHLTAGGVGHLKKGWRL